jgi:hypothetical protein
MRVLALLLCLTAAPCLAAPAAPSACGPWVEAAEKSRGIAPGLLGAIAIVESGRNDPRTHQRMPWPWTVTAEGVGTFYPGKAEAIQAVVALRGRGVKSIDVGCMQVNLLHHPTAFPDLDTAFDPAANTAYAATFLSRLHDRLGTWPQAAAAYHSMTPEVGAQYGRLIAAVWSGAPVPVVAGPSGIEVVQFPGGGQMRILRDATLGQGRVLGYLSGP